MARPIHLIQPAFTGGEISEDVASRVDLDKYQLALLNAENGIIRPYGAVKKRNGSAYCGSTKDNSKAVLKRFEFGNELSYLLEFGNQYLRIWRQGEYLGVELTTPYTQADLTKLRTVQSVDVMYICSGDYPVYKLARYSELEWTLNPVNWSIVPFDSEEGDENIKMVPVGEKGDIEIQSTGDIFTADMVGRWIKIEQRISGRNLQIDSTTSSANTTTATFSLPVGTAGHSISGQNFSSSVPWMIEKTGGGAVTVTLEAKYSSFKTVMGAANKQNESISWANITTVTEGDGDWTRSGTYYTTEYVQRGLPTVTDNKVYTGQARVKISGLTSTPLTLKIWGAKGPVKTISNLTGEEAGSESLEVGDSWKITSHGLWAGKFSVQVSYDDGNNWETVRTYSGDKDYNPTESGTVEDIARVRIMPNITSGTAKIDLYSYPYKKYGYAKITAYTNPTRVTAAAVKNFESGMPSYKWYWSAWGPGFGYPYAATFFQDRLVLGGCSKFPQRIWMSRTGNYEDFEVEKVSGTVTDDSGVSADLLSQQPYTIQHLLAVNDLIVFTEGNTWTISGSEVVTPTNISPRNQESYGVGNVKVIHVGNRSVYAQRRGSSIRDMGYSYDIDSYSGLDLTLLAKHLIRGHRVVDGDFAQEPDSLLYYIRDDGALLCLTYIPEQKVFGWSHFVTDGKYEAVCVISEGNEDRVYVIVNRTIGNTTKRYLERFALDQHTDRQQDYKMLDSYKLYDLETASATLTGLSHLEGKDVLVIGDNYYYDDQTYTVTNGQIVLPEPVSEAIVGLPYSLIVEQPNVDVGNTETGTMQGRLKNVAAATLRLTRSYGGAIGPNATAQNKIVVDKERMELGENVLFSGDKKVVLGVGGYNLGGRVYIRQDEPFPFSINAIIREVTFGDV